MKKKRIMEGEWCADIIEGKDKVYYVITRLHN